MSEPRTFKGLLLEMKLASSSEERILAEEQLVAMHDSLRKLVEVYETALNDALDALPYGRTRGEVSDALKKRAEIMGEK
jgi:hypothetical protein